MKTKRIQKRRRVYRKKTTTKKTMNFKVRKIVKSMSETKSNNAVSLNQSISTADAATTPFYRTMNLVLGQGAGDNQRIGNRVFVSSGVVEGYVNMLPYDAITNPFPSLKAKIWICSYKRMNSTNSNNQTLALADFSSFFKSGASNIPFQGNLGDMILPVNDDVWTVHRTKVITLGLGGSSTTYADSTGPHEGSGKYQGYFKFYIGKYLGSLRYDDATGSQYPTNRNLWLVCQAVRTDGTLGPITGAELHYNVTIKYKDM